MVTYGNSQYLRGKLWHVLQLFVLVMVQITVFRGIYVVNYGNSRYSHVSEL